MDKSADAASVASTPVAVATITTTTHTTALPATSPSAAANKRCLDDDGVCLNATVFEGVQYPTAHAARIARDALRAAQQYYQLFFECDCCSCNNNNNNNNNNERKDDDGSVHSNTISVGAPAVGTRTPFCSSSQQQQQRQQQCNVPSPSQPLAACSHHHTVHMHHRVTAQQTAAYYARTPASTSATPLYITPAMSTTAATTTTHMSPNVLDSPYHTFFPPVLSPRHRERIIERILGHTPSPFSRWKWHKATAYANMHGCLSQAHTARQPLLLPSRQEQRHKQPQPASSEPISPLRSGEGNNNTNLASTHADDKDGRAAAVAAAVPATTTSNMTSTLCFPLVPHTIVQHPHTQRLTHAATAATSAAAATSATTLMPSSPLPHVHTRSDAAPPHHPSLPLQQQLAAPPLHMASSSSPACCCSTQTTTSPRPPAETAAASVATTTTVAVAAEANTRAATMASTAAVTPVAAGDAVAYSFPTSRQGPEYFHAAAEDGTRRLILIMVGLPARGKTFLAQKICRLLSWHGCKATVHNLQVLWRRKLAEALASDAATGVSHARGCVSGRDATDGDDAAHETTTAAARRTHDAGDTRGAPAAAAAAGCIRAAHFAQLLREPGSLARRVYRDVLHSVADDCRHFFEFGGGEVVVLNDDFVTESLRRDAEAVLRPLATQLIFMEVVRAAADNAPFNECKVRDPGEYPPDVVAAEDARVDFAQRVALLECAYEPLSDAEENAATAATTTTPKTSTAAAAATTTTTTAAQLTRTVTNRTSGGTTCMATGPHDTTLSATPGLDDGDAGGGGVNASLRRDGGEDGYDDDGGAKNAVTVTRASDDDTPYPAARGRRRRACIKVRYPDVVEVHGVSGYAASRIVSYVMNITQAKMQHPIYFVRHGQSCYNLEDRIGGDPLLTAQGMRDAAALLEFLYSLNAQLRAGTAGGVTPSAAERTRVTRHTEGHDGVCGGVAAERDRQQHEQQQRQLSRRDEETTNKSHKGGGEASAAATTRARAATIPAAASTAVQSTMTHLASMTPAPVSPAALQGKRAGLEIWTSQLRRAIQTAELSERLLNIRTLRWSSLNEIHAGVCEGMTYDDVMTKYPLIDQFRKHSKYTFRYPDGESYQDLVVRLEPVIMELENANKVVVVVAHQAVLRCLLAYFGSTSAESSVCVRVPHRTVWRCTYDSKGIASLDELTLDNVEVGFACSDGVGGGGGSDVRAGADDTARGDDGAGDNGNCVRDRDRRGDGGTVTTSEEVEVDVI